MRKINKLKFKVLLLCLIAVVITLLPVSVNASNVNFNKKTADIKDDICGYSLNIKVDNNEQKFVVKSDEVKTFKVNSKKYSNRKKTMTVTSTIYVNRDVATVRSKVKSVYKLKNNKWKLSTIIFSDQSITEIPIVGSWKGTYTAGQGTTAITITVKELSKDGFATGIIDFYAVPTNPTIPSGSYTFTGGYDLVTGNVTFAGNEWIEQPTGYSMISFYGHVDLLNKKIVASNYDLSISKVE